jgi:aminoglycoside phosphotransferase (APT) family kinase protein
MTSTARRVVAEVFPDRTVERIDSQNARPGNETVRVEFTDHDPVYVKVDLDAVGRIRREVAAVRHADSHGSVNVPEILAADTAADSPYMVTSPLAGGLMNERWTAGDDREALMRAVGETVAAVHDAQVNAVGRIDGWDGTRLQIESMDWTDTLCTTVRSRVEEEFSDRFSDIPDDLLSTIRTVEPALDPEAAVLLHGDPSRINVHLDPNGLLDWERALAGDAAFDLTETIFHHLGQPDVGDAERPDLREALLDGYRDQRGHLPAQFETYEPLYRAIAHLLAPQTFDKWAPGADPPTDELEANVREEAYSRMAAAEDALL